MTAYVKSTNFASKDSLASGNPLKIVKGTEIDIEFNNIATAVDSKADTTSPAFSGIPLAPTAAVGNNTTQLATTAFVTTAMQALYPVGSVYINANVATNPGTLMGFGTWSAFGAGRVLVGFNASNSLFDTAEETGGSYDATLVSHNHTGTTGGQSADHVHGYSGTVSAAGAHMHNLSTPFGNGAAPSNQGNVGGPTVQQGTGGQTTVLDRTDTQGNHVHTYSGNTGGVSSGHDHAFTTSTSGSSATNANIQPYITVYMWKRTA